MLIALRYVMAPLKQFTLCKFVIKAHASNITALTHLLMKMHVLENIKNQRSINGSFEYILRKELQTSIPLYGNQRVANTATTTANIFTTCKETKSKFSTINQLMCHERFTVDNTLISTALKDTDTRKVKSRNSIASQIEFI